MTAGDNAKRTPGDVLREAALRKSARKRSHVMRTVDQMRARGETITFAAVARQAKVSTWLVYQGEVGDYIRAAKNGDDPTTDWLAEWDNDNDEQLYD